jgi:hypothetical protein
MRVFMPDEFSKGEIIMDERGNLSGCRVAHLAVLHMHFVAHDLAFLQRVQSEEHQPLADHTAGGLALTTIGHHDG